MHTNLPSRDRAEAFLTDVHKKYKCAKVLTKIVTMERAQNYRIQWDFR